MNDREDLGKKTLEELRAAGHRITAVRSHLVKLFSARLSPVDATELVESLAGGGNPVNKTTVYRELEFLLGKGVIRELDLLEGKKRYELVRADDHHHHIVCRSCGTIRCVPLEDDFSAIERHLMKKYRFKVTSHTLEFFGVCSDCR